MNAPLPPGRPSTQPLSAHTTLALGGPAREWKTALSVEEIVRVLAMRAGTATLVLGGGSNVVCADEGFDGLVVAVQTKGVHLSSIAPTTRGSGLDQLVHRSPNVSLDSAAPGALTHLQAGGDVWVHVAAGEEWDRLVEATCRWGLAGIECLSGIPGRVGATPIQNVGAYGQELSDSLWGVWCVSRTSQRLRYFPAAECGLGYRHSVFKGEARDQYVVVEVVLRLRLGGEPHLAYAEIAQHFSAAPPADLSAVRLAVLETRRAKSMVFDRGDPNTRNCGSFFVNPMVTREHYSRLQGTSDGHVPGYPAGDKIKVPAAWLIERAGFARGERKGNVGLSTKHTLCLVAHDGATTRELVAYARSIHDRVLDRFGVILEPEPVFVGVNW